MSKPLKSGPEAELTAHRAAIDALDDQLIALLKERIEIVRKVGALKANHWPSDCHIRSGREGEMHTRIAKHFKASRFHPKAAVALWRLLIGSSTTLESPLNIAYLAEHPVHYWLVREYFGPLVGLTSIATPGLVEKSNLLVLPAPELHSEGWWRHPLSHKGKPLHLFARLPLVEEELPNDAVPAVALAAIKPEPSGDDISYIILKSATAPTIKGARIFSRGEHHLVILDGFIGPDSPAYKQLITPEIADHYWLGAHPRPLNFGA